MVETEYANTDFDLHSRRALDALNRELSKTCSVLHYTVGDNGHWYSIVEAQHSEDSTARNAERDILAMIDAIAALSPAAKAELDS